MLTRLKVRTVSDLSSQLVKSGEVMVKRKKRCVFSLDLKMLTELPPRMCSGRLFQSTGALLASALPPKEIFTESGEQLNIRH